MKRIKLIVGGAICVSYLLSSVFSIASDKIGSTRVHFDNSTRVHFDKGSSGTIIKSTVTGDKVNDYTLVAKAGQMMHISMESRWPHSYFNIIAPDNNAIYNGSMSGNTYEQRLAVSGQYTVRTYQMGDARDEGKTSAYALTFKIID